MATIDRSKLKKTVQVREEKKSEPETAIDVTNTHNVSKEKPTYRYGRPSFFLSADSDVSLSDILNNKWEIGIPRPTRNPLFLSSEVIEGVEVDIFVWDESEAKKIQFIGQVSDLGKLLSIRGARRTSQKA